MAGRWPTRWSTAMTPAEACTSSSPATAISSHCFADWSRRPSPPTSCSATTGSRASQVIKQADVLMLHHLVPEEVRPARSPPNLDFYGPRTAHGSSLSPAIHAAAAGPAGRPTGPRAVPPRARLDLDDLTGTTAGGLHLATMGGVWQALAHGFLGLRPHPDHLDIDPRLPRSWDALSSGCTSQAGPRLTVRATDDPVCVTSAASPCRFASPDGPRSCVRRRCETYSVEGNGHMTTVLAALDASAAARPVLEVAIAIGEPDRRQRRGHPRDRHGPRRHPRVAGGVPRGPAAPGRGPGRADPPACDRGPEAVIAAVFGARSTPRVAAAQPVEPR